MRDTLTWIVDVDGGRSIAGYSHLAAINDVDIVSTWQSCVYCLGQLSLGHGKVTLASPVGR